MAELLCKHNLHGTFYVPIYNREGYPVLNRHQLREIGGQFEIGSHTLDHCYLNSVAREEARRQITAGKTRLEELIEQPVAGFCYPGGKFTLDHVAAVKSAGFHYARTTANLRFDLSHCRFRMPTTIQFYPHARAVYLRNFVRAGHWDRRAQGLLLALRSENWISRIYSLFNYSCEQNSTFHIWAHSYEIDMLSAWHELDRFFAHVASRIPVENRLSNQQLAYLSPARLSRRTVIAGERVG